MVVERSRNYKGEYFMTKRNSFIESTKETDERLEALKQLYPEIFSDGKINLDAFKDVTGTSDLPEGQDRTPGYYGLYWPGKRAAKQLARKEAEGTLEPVPGDGVNEDTTHNIYIEGDNLEVLRILKQSYKGRVKMIYIDPPYNTGNDFIYPDDFKMPVEEYLKMTGQADEGGKKLVTNLKSNGAFHTTWLNMMYPRLQLARELLTEDGVIFISIDDNEQANLKLVCDDVFGEENFIADLVWERAFSPKNDARFISNSHDYVLMYAKNIENFIIGRLPRTEEANARYSNPDNDPRGVWMSSDISVKTYNAENDYPITTPSGRVVEPPAGRCWRLSAKAFAERLQDNRIWFGPDGNGTPRIKRFLTELKFEGMAPTSILFYKEVGHSQEGAQEVSKILDGGFFSGPKPIRLMRRLMTLANLEKDSIIVDFFSGSASTAHAVMELNKDDNSNRKFVMVQLPHKCEENSEAAKAGYSNICEIGKERIRRAGAKILEEAKSNKDMFSEDYQLDIGFKVYRLQNSNFLKYTPVEGQNENSQNKLFEEFEKNQIPLVEGWKAENVLTEIILKQGFALDCTKEKVDSFKKNKIWKITDSADTVSKKIKLYVCLDNFIEEETIKNLTLNDDEKFICLDAAIDDSAYARLADKGRIETI